MKNKNTVGTVLKSYQKYIEMEKKIANPDIHIPGVRKFNTVYFKLFLFQNYMLALQQRNELQYVVIAGTSGRLQCESVCHLTLPKFTGDKSVNTVKPAHAVTSIKQSPTGYNVECHPG
jgi:hypothetical protein